MPETVQHCPLCGATQSELFDYRLFHDQPVNNRLCEYCGLVYQSPRMTEEELDRFYAYEYRRLYQGGEGPSPKDLAVQRARAGALFSFTQTDVKKVSYHLDIGSSAGLLLQRFQETYACQPVGIEPGEAYRAYAQAQELEVYASLEELKVHRDIRFDLISMVHVLEHIAAPVDYLVNLRTQLLTRSGVLLIEVPNLYAHECFEVAHLVSYSSHSLKQTLNKAGFEINALRAHGEPRSEMLSLYLSVLARPAVAQSAFQLTPEKSVRRKRQFGMFRRRVITRLFPRKAWLPVKNIEF
jgi:SAM-dependent methyltransferase